ncbi:MAG: alpha/beta fold hydrolase [Armatimonadota bacterium]
MTRTRFGYLERGLGPAVVFLHGIGGGAASWRYQIEEFARAYRVLAWDMPGYGGSQPAAQYSFPRYAQWLGEFLVECAIERPILVGHSIGGMIVQEYLAVHPEAARAVVLYATSPAFGRKEGEWQQQFLRARLGPLDEGKTMAKLAPEIVRGLVGSRAKSAGIELAVACMAAVPDETYRAVVLSLVEFDRREGLGKITAPCLLIAGEEDSNAPPAMMEKMAARIPGGQYHRLPGLGHLAHLEDPVAFDAVLWTFLDGVTRGAA